MKKITYDTFNIPFHTERRRWFKLNHPINKIDVFFFVFLVELACDAASANVQKTSLQESADEGLKNHIKRSEGLHWKIVKLNTCSYEH